MELSRTPAGIAPSFPEHQSPPAQKAITLVVLPTSKLGGAETVLKMLAEQASRVRDEVHVVILSRGPGVGWRGMPGNVVLHHVPAGSEKTGALKAVPLLRRLSRTHRIEETVSSHLHVNAFLGLLRRLRLLRCGRMVFRESTVFIDRFRGVKLQLFKLLYRVGYRSGDLVVCQTEYMKESLLRLVPRARSWPLTVLANPIDLPSVQGRVDQAVEPEPAAFAPFVVSAGRLIPEKGFDVLLRAFALVRRERPDLTLLILGEGPVRPVLEDLAGQLGLEKNVRFLGRVANPMPYFRAAELSVVASRVEGYPNVLLEKMAVSRTVVSTRCADGVEHLKGIHVCNPGDVEALAAAMQEALGAEERRHLMAEMLVERTPERYWDRLGRELARAERRRRAARLRERAPAPGRARTPETARVRIVHVLTVPMSLLFFRGQVGFMKRHGLQPSFVSAPGPELDAFGAREDVAVAGVPMRRAITPLLDLVVLWKLWRHLRATRPQIVHGHTPKGGLLGLIAARLSGIPVRIYHMRGLPFLGATGFRRSLLRWTEQVACCMAHRVISVSPSNREVAVAEGLCPANKIVVLAGGSSNGVDADRFSPVTDRGPARRRLGLSEEALVVGFVGRLVRDKGLVELASAWFSLRERYSEAHLLLVGPFEAQDPLPGAVRQALESDPRVHLTGLTYDTPPLYAAMDLLVLPTYREGFPNVLLEAAAMGLPVVASRVPGCVDAVRDGETGVLVPARDVPALIRAIETYLADDGLRRAHGLAGRARVLEEFRQEVVWQALYQEYARLLAGVGITMRPDTTRHRTPEPQVT